MSSLSGKRILVTRPRAQAASLMDRLSQAGAIPVAFPTIEVLPMEDNPALDRAIANLSAFAWVIFTSVNGVEGFWQRLALSGTGAPGAFRGVRVAAIGPATAQALKARAVLPDFVPAEYVADAILPGLGNVRGQRILLPRAEIARKALLDALIQAGSLPEEIPVYRTIAAQPTTFERAEFERGVDAVTFTSSSTVRNYFDLLGPDAIPLMRGAAVACIGPITSETARACGLTVDLVATEYTMEGLVEALEAYFSNHPKRNEP